MRNRVHLDVVRPAAAVEQAGLGEGSGPFGVCHTEPDGNEVNLVPGSALGVEQTARLEAELANHFEMHPDAEVIRSLPGLGMILGARVLAEFGDDRNRYADAKSRKSYAGTLSWGH